MRKELQEKKKDPGDAKVPAGVVVTARLRSRRLPNKALRRIGRDPMIVKLLKNLVQNNQLPVVVAMPGSEENDRISGVIRESNAAVDIHRGQDDSPAHRVLAAAEDRGWKYVAIVPHDCPFIDHKILQRQVAFAAARDLERAYITRMPEGTYGEVVKVSALHEVLKDAKPTEHISYLLRAAGLRQEEYRPPGDYQFNARLTVDYPEDLMVVRAVDHGLAPGYSTLTLIDFLKQNAFILNQNRLPDVSVVVTCYNYEKYIVDALASVAMQTDQSWECLVYDDGSDDNTLRKIVCYVSALDGVVGRKFRICAMPKNEGLGAICNRALGSVRGRYYIRLDADDILRNDALQTMRRALDSARGSEGVWSGYKILEENGVERDVLPAEPGYEYHPACCMLRTDTVLATGYRERQMFYEGADFLDRFRKRNQIELVNEPLWVRRLHGDQMTGPETEAARATAAARLAGEGIKV